MLFEKLILSPEDIKSINTSKNRVKAISTALFNSSTKLFGNIDSYDGIGKAIVDSVQRDGYDDANNHFLKYAQEMSKQPFSKDVSYEQATLISNLIRQGTITPTELRNPRWLFSINAYSGDVYKIKALAFLTSPDVRSYGDPRTAPIQEILATNKVDNIKRYLDNWQTSGGDTSAQEKEKTLGTFLSTKCDVEDSESISAYLGSDLLLNFMKPNEATVSAEKVRKYISEDKLNKLDFLSTPISSLKGEDAARAIRKFLSDLPEDKREKTFGAYVQEQIGNRKLDQAATADVCEQLISYIYGGKAPEHVFDAVNEAISNSYVWETLLDTHIKEVNKQNAAKVLEKFIKEHTPKEDDVEEVKPLRLNANDLIKAVRQSYNKGMTFDSFVNELKKTLGV